ncbi:MAG: hypothetical protein FAF05_02465 [Epsilonproteobacteria bacterium]|nr:hypothetical protein [Campylobacterota bacterium]
MNDFKLKLLLSILSGILFSFIFIILAFAVPAKEKKQMIIKKPQGRLEQISHALKNR